MIKHSILLFLCCSAINATNFEDQTINLFKSLSPRIIGGDEAPEGMFKWQVAFYIQKPEGGSWCGGALIGDRWVLTAGHCVHRATKLKAALGSNALVGEDDKRVVLETDEFILHEKYNSLNLENDIALVRLPEHESFNNDNIEAISLSSSSLHEHDSVLVSGFGLTSDSDEGPSPYLMYVYLSVISTVECQKAYGTIVDGVVCAKGGYFKQSTCEGDSGGPLVKSLDGKNFVHVGVVSFGHSDGCESGNPVGFTKTDYFREWIREHTGV